MVQTNRQKHSEGILKEATRPTLVGIDRRFCFFYNGFFLSLAVVGVLHQQHDHNMYSAIHRNASKNSRSLAVVGCSSPTTRSQYVATHHNASKNSRSYRPVNRRQHLNIYIPPDIHITLISPDYSECIPTSATLPYLTIMEC